MLIKHYKISQTLLCRVKFLISIFIISFIAGAFFYPPQSIAQESRDVLAIRIVSNLEHMSALRWYKSKGFTGSPQSLMVDGYDAIRDGRTVYINAANIGADNRLYTNIYIISFNQGAEGTTLDIFGRILENWKFNTNIENAGLCFQDADKVCSIDMDCPVGDYCLSPKAQVVRDTKRLADMADIRKALEEYKNANGRFHTMSAGSYISQKTLSVWPSWNNIFAKELKMALPVDPINVIGPCADNFKFETCWDENALEFAGTIPDGLPAGSRVYAYSAAPDGSSYNLCAGMESSYGQAMGASSCAGASTPLASFLISGVNMPAVFTGDAFAGYVEVATARPENLVWTLTRDSDFSSWSPVPSLGTVSNLNQRVIRSDSAGTPGTYNLTLRITDGVNTVARGLSITVRANTAPTITQVPDFTVPIGHSMGFSVFGRDPDDLYPLRFNVTGLPQALSGQMSGNRTFLVSGTVSDPVATYNVSATAINSANISSSPMNFSITVINNPPIFTSSPATHSMPGSNYVYVARAVDPDGHSINNWSATGLPPGFTFDAANRMITGTAPESGSFVITITATDQYGASVQQTYTLWIGYDSFSLSRPADGEIYVCPNGICPPLTNVYYFPVTYNGTADASTGNTVTYSMFGNPSWLRINRDTGAIQGTPTNNVTHPGRYLVTVNAVDENGVRASTEFSLLVHPNSWCGDGICDSVHENISRCLIDCASRLSASIISPSTGSTIMESACLVLRGTASGGIPPYNFTWTSNIDDSLGDGQELRLPAGCTP